LIEIGLFEAIIGVGYHWRISTTLVDSMIYPALLLPGRHPLGIAVVFA
jgi:hypothetical protein